MSHLSEFQACLAIMIVAVDAWLGLTLLITLWFLRRQCVIECRRDIRKLIGAAVRTDIYREREWRWRWELYEQVGYNEMIVKFWKLADEFWPEEMVVVER